MRLPTFVCLSVCLSVSKVTQKCMDRFGWNVACRQMSGHGRTDELLSPIRIIVRIPEPGCFLQYRMCYTAEFYYIGNIPCKGTGHPLLQQHMVLFTVSHGNNFVGGTYAPPSALLVINNLCWNETISTDFMEVLCSHATLLYLCNASQSLHVQQVNLIVPNTTDQIL